MVPSLMFFTPTHMLTKFNLGTFLLKPRICKKPTIYKKLRTQNTPSTNAHLHVFPICMYFVEREDVPRKRSDNDIKKTISVDVSSLPTGFDKHGVKIRFPVKVSVYPKCGHVFEKSFSRFHHQHHFPFEGNRALRSLSPSFSVFGKRERKVLFPSKGKGNDDDDENEKLFF